MLDLFHVRLFKRSACTFAALGSFAALAQSLPLPAKPVDLTVPVTEVAYPSEDYGHSRQPGDDRYARTHWRVIEQTGNCCETFVTVTQDGRLLDYGGTYINYTDDRGQTWKSVRPALPLVNGEGAIVAAPGGDVLGVQWDPYSGDHLQFYKYEADTGEWKYTEMPVHSPFYDREWIGVIPGPIVVDGKEYEYVSFVKGAYPSKEVWFYSLDGLNYTQLESKQLELILAGGNVQGPLPFAPNPELDWIQTNTNTLLTPLGAGFALAGPDIPFNTWALFDGSAFKWKAFRFPDNTTPTGRYQLDSAGRLHNVVVASDGTSFEYRTSGDGGLTWFTETVALPPKHVIEEWDFRANLTAGVAAVAIHASNLETDTDQDLVYKFDIRADPVLKRMYRVGLGDINATGGFGNNVRIDFQSVAIFEDGRVAVSLIDSTTTNAAGTAVRPGVAVELETELGDRIPPREEVVPELGEAIQTFTFDSGSDGWTTSGMPTTWTRSSPGTQDGADDKAASAFAFEGPLNYRNEVEVALTSPTVAVPAGAAVVQFWTKVNTEKGFDFLIAEWSADGKAWTELGRMSGQNDGYPGWQQVTYGLEAPGGDIYVRFRFSADLACSALDGLCGPLTGVRVDQVIVGTQAQKPGPPADAGTDAPGRQPDAGTGPADAGTDVPGRRSDPEPTPTDEHRSSGCQVGTGSMGSLLAGLAFMLFRRRRVR